MCDRRVIVVGHQGQDGRFLSQRLRQRGDAVLGIGRRNQDVEGLMPPVGPCRIDQLETVCDTIRAVRPDEVYYLAAHHSSSQAASRQGLYEDYCASISTNFVGLLHFLEAIRLHHPRSRLFFASSSLIFGNCPVETPQSETTATMPEEPYALCKKLAGDACKDYRHRYGLFASVGILYNHESALRGDDFLSKRVIRAVIAARQGKTEKLVVGNLDATVDWGYAPDFVDAFLRILALEHADDFVVATGVAHTVRDFLAAAFGHVGLDWKDRAVEDSSVLVQRRMGRVGNSAKLQMLTGWRPSLSFEKMVAHLVDEAGLLPS